VLRLQAALSLAGAGRSLAATALRAGYADQAHFSREVKALAGVPATELIRPAAPVQSDERDEREPGGEDGRANGLAQEVGANREMPLPSGSRTTA
jgi:AraC-like DNA-binding protein